MTWLLAPLLIVIALGLALECIDLATNGDQP